MNSSWDKTKQQSTYHFDSYRRDSAQDVLIYLGRLPVTWAADLPGIIENSRPATWETRGYKAQGVNIPPADLAAEEYDIERVGGDPKMVITNLNWEIPSSLKSISKKFALEDCMERIHVQWPGQVWTRHIDKLGKWCPQDPSRVMRIMIQLTDWCPGQFWEYGNYHHSHWAAGEVTCFDWPNIPHCTANAGHDPRVTLQLTGNVTGETQEFLASLPM